MLKHISITLSFILLFSTTVHAASASALKNIVDEFNYAITVEWDQQDKSFYQNELQKFEQNLEDLQKDGLTREEITSFIIEEIDNQKLTREIKQTMALVDAKKLDVKTAQKQLMDNIQQTYNQGASWRGEYVITAVGGVLLVAALAIIAAVMLSTKSSAERDTAMNGAEDFSTAPPIFPTDTSSPRPY